MSFGELFRSIREGRGIQQKSLARLAGFSVPTLLQIEQSKLIPTDETAKKFMDVLGIDNKTRNQLISALKKDRLVKKQQPTGVLAFGRALRDVLTSLNMIGSDFSHKNEPTCFKHIFMDRRYTASK